MKKEEKEKTKSRQKLLGDIWVSSLDVRNEGSLKPKKARSESSSILSGSKSSAVLGATKEKIMNVTRLEEKLFNVLVDPIKECVDERK